MNTAMWDNPLTARHIDILCNTLNWRMIPPICKTLMCGEVGQGAMEEPAEIVKIVNGVTIKSTLTEWNMTHTIYACIQTNKHSLKQMFLW